MRHPVGFHLSPLHPRLMYLPLLLISPVQHPVAQQGSLFHVRDVKYWQISVNQGVNCGLLAWLFASHNCFWWCIFAPCLPAFVRVIPIAIIVLALLSSSRPAYAPATHTGAVTTTCTACSLLAYLGPVCQLQTFTVRGVFGPRRFWALGLDVRASFGSW